MFKLYKKYLKEYKKEVILGPMFKLLEAVFELIVPLIMANIIDNGINGNMTDEAKIRFVWQQGGLLLLVAITGLCSTLVCQYMASKTAQGFQTKLRSDIFKHINSLSYKELDSVGTSGLISRINNDCNNVTQSVAMLIRLVVRAPFLVIGATIMAFTISAKIALIFVATGILLSILIYVIMRNTVPKNKDVQKSIDRVTEITQENLTGNRQIRAFSMEEYEQKRFYDESNSLQRKQVKVGIISAVLNPATTIIINAAIILVVFLASGKIVSDLKLSSGQITALVNYLNQMMVAIVVVSNLVVIFSRAFSSAKRINDLFDLENSVTYGNLDNVNLDTHCLRVNDLSFTYDGSNVPAIEGISFELKPNETLGIIGGTGSGKSTLGLVLTHAYNKTSGSIILGEEEIEKYDEKTITKTYGHVLQKSRLFKGSILDNLKMGNKDLTEEEAIESLKKAEAYSFVSKLPNGLNEIVLEGGKNFSGGEKQRLSIARGFAMNPKILILDDSSSALDYKTDHSLRKNIRESKLTTIIIAERYNAVRDCNQILVLDNGKMVGLGTHDYLLNTCDVYKEIVASQDYKEEA